MEKQEKPKKFKATDLIKKPFAIEKIYEQIWFANERGEFKHFIPSGLIITDETKLELMNNGFKVYTGDWDGIMKNVTIIEW